MQFIKKANKNSNASFLLMLMTFPLASLLSNEAFTFYVQIYTENYRYIV